MKGLIIRIAKCQTTETSDCNESARWLVDNIKSPRMELSTR